MPSTNINMLQTVANGLGELKDDMVFIESALPYGSDSDSTDIIEELMCYQKLNLHSFRKIRVHRKRQIRLHNFSQS